MSNRREFVKAVAAMGTGALLGGRWQPAWASNRSPRLAKFIQPLRGVGNGGIPFAASDGTRTRSGITAAHYSLSLEQYEDQLHPGLPNPTRLWGYRPSNISAGGMRHLGGIVVAQRGVPVQVTATNALPATHILPVDATIMGAEQGQGANHASVHLHGGFVPWISDGGPHSWFDPQGGYGVSATGAQPGSTIFGAVNPSLAAGQAEYYYPNQQGARMLWYHDHAHGITRLNAYAGLASAYVITDSYESQTMTTGYGLPGPLDPRTCYLVFQDKTFVGPETEALDASWYFVIPASRAGDLWYPHVHDEDRLKKWTPLPAPNPSAVPEQFGDTILVNGTVAPYLVVEQRQYRLRMLNACNSRFLNPRLLFAKGASGVDATEAETNKPGPAFVQVGTEGGFLPAPVMLNGKGQPRLLLAPAERADLIVDFRDVPAGSILILYNDAAAPFPGGDAAEDFYPGNPKTPVASPGFTPDTRTVLQIRVTARTGAADASIQLPATGTQNPLDVPYLVAQQPGVPTAVPPGVPVRRMTLNEGFDAYGRLLQQIGTDQPLSGAGTREVAFGRGYDTPPTEVDANELGWKETVRMNPGQATRVVMRFDLPAGLPFTVPPSPRTGGNEYVWHCHILEHEEHDMMRPLIVN